LYFNLHGQLVLVDLGSSNGTSITREGTTSKLEEMTSFVLQKGDLIAFGLSTRKYRVELDPNKAKGASTDR
jgi:pSer/pThr/pTyr-binding forkhead associated (FHA) protein